MTMTEPVRSRSLATRRSLATLRNSLLTLNALLTLTSAIVLLGIFSAASAQSLTALASPDTVLTLGYTPQAPVLDSLPQDLAAIDWAAVGDTLERLSALMADSPFGDEFGLDGFSDFGSAFGDFEEGLAELDEECPGVGNAAMALDFGKLASDYLLTVSITPFSPIPSVTALARVTDEMLEPAATLQDTLIGCFADGPTFEEDGVPLYVLGDGSDLPVVIARTGNLFLAGTNPDTVRTAIRLAGGSDEPSYAQSRLAQAGERLAVGGFGISVDFGAIAALLENFVGAMANDPGIGVLADRGLAALRTLGGIAGQLGTTPEGLLSEMVIAVDPNGGDPELAELLLCNRCSVSSPFLAPAGSVGVSSQYVPLRGLVDYLQGWLDDLGPVMGEELDLRALLRDELGLDLDSALLDWIGSTVHTVRLEAIGPRIDTLLYAPETAIIIPVSSPEAARAGLEQLAAALEPFAAELLAMNSPFAALVDEFDFDQADSVLAVRERDYRGIAITRIQSSLNVDFAWALVGNNLVIGYPSSAVEPIIDTFLGAPDMFANPNFRDVVRRRPDGAITVTYSEDGAQLRGIADLLELAVQPLAFFLNTELQSGGDDGFAAIEEDFGSVDLSGVTPLPLTSDIYVGELDESDETDFGQLAEYIQLTGLEPGDRVTVELTSEAFDTYLWLIDAASERYIAANDDAPDITRSELVFEVQPGREYWLEVTSFGGSETGTYQLYVQVERASGGSEETPPEEAVEPPTFAELLELGEVAPRVLDILADHLSFREDTTSVDGEVVYFRSLIRIRW